MDLLEREAAWRELDAALNDAAAGQGRVALVSGEAGIGKTVLVEQFARARRCSRRGRSALCTISRAIHPRHSGQAWGAV